MSSIQLLGHSMGRLYSWVFHAPEVLLRAGTRLVGSVVFALVLKTQRQGTT